MTDLSELVEVSPLKNGGGKIRWALFHPGIPKPTLILSMNVIIECVGELESQFLRQALAGLVSGVMLVVQV